MGDMDWMQFSKYEFFRMYEMFLCKIVYLKKEDIYILWNMRLTIGQRISRESAVFFHGSNYTGQNMVSDRKQDVYMILKMPYIDIIC